MMKKTMFAVLLALPTGAYAQQDAPRITAITLFEAGLAEVVLDASGMREASLTIPLKDIDDVLKSLILTGEFSASPVIRLSGENPVEDAFLGSPIGPDQISDVAGILSSIRGTRVLLTRFDRSIEGVVSGVSQPSCSDDGVCIQFATIIDDEGTIHRYPLDGGTSGVTVKILDEAIVEAMRTGLGALAEQSNGMIRTVRVEMGEGSLDAGLRYVVQAPMWKTAYRTLLEDEGVSLQAWAVIENATPIAWDDVGLTISSGSPVTLQASLHARQWGLRDVFEAEQNMPKRQARQAMEMLSDSFSSGAGASELMAMAPMANLEVSTTMSETLSDSRFTFPETVSIASGEMISVPFLAEDLDAESLTVWSGRTGLQTGSPDMILSVENDLPVRLPAGIMTIHSAETGYVGDASFPMLAPGDDVQVKFGTNAKITISEESTSRRIEKNLVISRGVITLIDEEVNVTTYRISAPGKAGTLMIDHPYLDIAVRDVQGAAAEEIITKPGERQVIRYTIDTLPDAESVLVVEERVPVRSSIQIGNVDPDTLLLWSNRASINKDERLLRDVADLMRKRSDAEMTVRALDEERRTLIEEQQRVAGLIRSVPNLEAMRDRYLSTLAKTEDRLDALTIEQMAANDLFNSLSVKIGTMLE